MRPDPIPLGTLKESAYGKTLAVDGTTVYLLTPTAMWRFSPEQKPTETKLDLKYSPAFTNTELIFWTAGRMQSIPKTGGAVKSLGPVKHRPRKIVAADDHFGWLDLSDGGSFTLQTLKNGKPNVLYRTTNKVTSPMMLGDRIYFVERATGGNTPTKEIQWRIGGVSVNPGVPHIFGRWEVGRTPSMLGGKTEIYYFDMPGRSVRRLSADLAQNAAIANKVVCTPFAVSDRVICSRVEGLYELPKGGGEPKILADKPMGLTVNIAASDKMVAWLSDTGENELTLRVLPLSPIDEEIPTKSTLK